MSAPAGIAEHGGLGGGTHGAEFPGRDDDRLSCSMLAKSCSMLLRHGLSTP